MKANESSLLDFLRGPKQFEVPIYQRMYSWTTAQCDRLWNDLVDVAQDRDGGGGHFVGSIVYIESGLFQVTTIPKLLLIDGQQRLTTISLLLCGLSNHITEKEVATQIKSETIRNYYLINREEDGDLRYKILLTDTDRASYVRLINGDASPDTGPTNLLVRNYRFFLRKLADTTLSPDEIYQAINRLEVVDVALDRRYDDPQLIFDSLNSTGIDLSEPDRIRNYILMGLEPGEQKDLYERHWHPMEESFGRKGYDEWFNWFVRDYLTIKNEGRIPKVGGVYEAFKAYAQGRENGSSKELVADMHRFSNYYLELALGKGEADSDIKEALEEIRSLNVTVSYPFLLQLFDDFASGVLGRSDLLAILDIIGSYVFRRSICGIPTNSLNKTFGTLANLINEDKYLESVQAAFLMMDSYRRFPSDEEFTDAFKSRDIYSLRNRNYLLRKLENHKRKEYVNVDNYTIEHILPQNPNLSSAWISMLGERWEDVQAKYLHTIGNLTLTGYNPELSDRSFGEKRDMEGGFRESPIRLNRSLSGLESWTEEAIVRRAEELANQAEGVWPRPEIEQSVLESYLHTEDESQTQGRTMEHFAEHLTGDVGALFSLLQRRILNLDSAVKEEPKALYIAYKTTTNFVDVVPQRSNLILYLNLGFDEIDDPQGACRDVSEIGHWANGDIEFRLEDSSQIDYAMGLIRQSFAIHGEETGG